MKKLVTFDAAGTLIEHNWDPASIACASARVCGIDIPADQARLAYTTVTSHYRDELVALEKLGDRAAIYAQWVKQTAAWLRELGADPAHAQAVFEEFRRRAFSPGSREFGLFPDVLPTLSKLSEQDAILGIVSNWDHTLHTVLENLAIEDRFEFVIASLEFGYEKPDFRIFQEALRIAGVDADEALHVGDSLEDDFLGARSAGIDALLIDRRGASDLAGGRIASLLEVVEALKC
jgi:REG-2-like HAD superfamily hydrolase